MKVVFDTNVLLSAFLTRSGIAQQLFVRSLGAHQVLLSEYILEETSAKLTGKLAIPASLVNGFIRYLRARTTVIDLGPQPSSVEFSDKKDVPILHLLEVSGAHYFVTGDKKLLDLKKHDKTLVLSLREALELL